MTWIVAQEVNGTNLYGGPFTSDEIAWYLVNVAPSSLGGMVNLIGDQKFFVPKLVELAHQSKDLWTINRIAKKLGDLEGVNFYPWDLQPLDTWWANNSSHYTNWPYAQSKQGMAAFSACKYYEALTNFETVLSFDPKADKTRAYAVACSVELGNLEKAHQLDDKFALSDGRWRLWSQGKMMLATNNIEGATKLFFSIGHKYPTLQNSFIRPGTHVLRQVDWTLFNELGQATNN